MGVDVSLFDRLLRRPIYAQHPLSRQNVYKRNTEKGWYRPAFVNLIRNYRSHAGNLITNFLTKSNTPGSQVFPHQVAVIAPFREHVVRMRVALRPLNLAAVS